ncbi:uncharacterized protein EKO05_0005823 [Ascochyta rabiei]|uniref:DNA binding n=1 Tax=Didymella rabiei TaxID=5454 RepID=A0A163LVE0_DIDRA|nr:uncharacterized protein EKO05_0005823 [Ascochyta rabiei]KZM28155.1 DNA binding [Ascochyta rabiei]UPX15376.1 hypothetical protein EKO05_0005823 [Ascochyta rabiei]
MAPPRRAERFSENATHDYPSSPDPLAMSTHENTITSTRKPQRTPRAPSRTSSPSKQSRTAIVPGFDLSSPAKSMVLNTPRMGGASPWRIKVTVQAEPESDGENTMSPTVKKVTRTKTTTIPLKYHDAPSPMKRGRGRPRKSDAAGGTPAKPKRKGTPVRRTARSKSRDASVGPTGSSAADIDTDVAPKRKRGRPRKVVQPATEDEETLVVDIPETQDDNQIDATPLPTEQPQTVATNIATPEETELSKRLHARKGTPHATNPLAIEISSDEESDEVSDVLTPATGDEDEARHEQTRSHTPTQDPAEHGADIDYTEPFEHEDDDDEVEAENFAFDEGITRMPDDSTIIDSEGFSIISVDSLPTKSSPPKADENQVAPVPSIAAIMNRGYTNPAAVRQLSREQGVASKSSPGPARMLPASKPVKSSPAIAQPRHVTPAVDNEVPSAPPSLEPARAAPAKIETPKMGRALTAGVALQGVLDPNRFTPESSQELAADRRGSLDDLFRGFSEGSRRQLQEGLRLGVQLAQNRAEPSPSLPKSDASRTEAAPRERPIRTQRKWRTRLLTPEDEQNSVPAEPAAAESEVQYPILAVEEQVNPLPSPIRSEDEGEMSFQVDSIVASVMEEDGEQPEATTNTRNESSPAHGVLEADKDEVEEDYSDIWREEGSRVSNSSDPSSTEGKASLQEPDLFIDSVSSKPGRSRFQRRNARHIKRNDGDSTSQRPSPLHVQAAGPEFAAIDKGKARAIEDEFEEQEDSVASEGSDDTGMFFQSNMPAVFDKKRLDRRQPKIDKLDLSLLLNEGESLQPEPSPEKQSASTQPNPFLDTPPRFTGFPSSPKKSSPLRRELRSSDISSNTPSRLHDESTLPLAQSSPFHSRIDGDSMLSTASDQRQIFAEMEGVDVTSNSIRVLRDEADEYLDAYTPQERSLNEIKEVTEYSRTLQGDSSIMPSSPPQARRHFVQHAAPSSRTPSSVTRHPQSDTGSEATPTPLSREVASRYEAIDESSFVSTSSAGRSDGVRAAAQLKRESSASASASPPRAHPILAKFAPLPRIEPWTKTHYKALDKLHAAHLKYPNLFCSLAVPPTTLSRANAALLASFAATTEKNYVGAQVSAWGYTFTMTPQLITLCEVFMHLLTLSSIEDYEAMSGRGIEMGDVAPGRIGSKISREEVMRRLCTVVLGEYIRADEKKGFKVKKTGALRIVGASGEEL